MSSFPTKQKFISLENWAIEKIQQDDHCQTLHVLCPHTSATDPFLYSSSHIRPIPRPNAYIWTTPLSLVLNIHPHGPTVLDPRSAFQPSFRHTIENCHLKPALLYFIATVKEKASKKLASAQHRLKKYHIPSVRATRSFKFGYSFNVDLLSLAEQSLTHWRLTSFRSLNRGGWTHSASFQDPIQTVTVDNNYVHATIWYEHACLLSWWGKHESAASSNPSSPFKFPEKLHGEHLATHFSLDPGHDQRRIALDTSQCPHEAERAEAKGQKAPQRLRDFTVSKISMQFSAPLARTQLHDTL